MVIMGGVRSSGGACAATGVEAICRSLRRIVNLFLGKKMREGGGGKNIELHKGERRTARNIGAGKLSKPEP